MLLATWVLTVARPPMKSEWAIGVKAPLNPLFTGMRQRPTL